jgi:dipeptidyl aminopeptidase/acylaminoacyl peptidase
VLESTLLAQPFDAKRLRLTGDPVPFEEAVLYDAGYFRASFGVSDNGALVYVTGSRETRGQLFWYDLTGRQIGPLGEPAEFEDLAVSPDGRRLAATISDPATGVPDIWILDLARGNRTRFTFGPGPNIRPTWSPDGSRIAYTRIEKSLASTVVIKASNGVGGEEVVTRAEGQWFPTSWSPDGRYVGLRVRRPNAKTKLDIWLVPLFGDRKPVPLIETPFSEEGLSFSPDGRWISYVSDESGRDEVYAAPFPGPGGKWQVSMGGVIAGGWCPSRSEILYLTNDQQATSVAVRADASGFDMSPPKTHFRIPRSLIGAITPECDRLLIAVLPQGGQISSISLVSNWPALLKK